MLGKMLEDHFVGANTVQTVPKHLWMWQLPGLVALKSSFPEWSVKTNMPLPSTLFLAPHEAMWCTSYFKCRNWLKLGMGNQQVLLNLKYSSHESDISRGNTITYK